VLIDVATPDGKQSGNDSVVSTENLLTVRQAQITRIIGQLPSSHMAQVDAALKASLALT
jgi:mRNA-degrading endonuclease toxin of MazEF toxin-antitoxin module